MCWRWTDNPPPRLKGIQKEFNVGETRKTTASKSRAPKSTTGAGKEPVEQSANTEPTQAEQDAVKAKEDKASSQAESVEKENDNEGSEADASNGGSVTPDDNDGGAIGILGAFKVRAKSDQGFWRSGVQFLRTKETVVLVVDEEPEDNIEVVAQADIEPELILFMSKEKAKRVYDEPNLVVEDVDASDVVDIKDAK